MSETITVVGKGIDADDISIVVNDQEISGWTSARVTAGIESCPRVFELGMTEAYPDGIDAMQISPGDPCQIYAGHNLLVTGYVDRWVGHIAAGQHSVQVIGRGMCQDLVDCAAIWGPGGIIKEASVLAVAQKLAAPYGVTVAGASGPAVGQGGKTLIPYIVMMLGETCWELIERLCRIAGMLAYELPDGSLWLTSYQNTVALLIAMGNGGALTTAASGFEEGVNVVDATFSYTMDQRYSTYEAYRIAFDPYQDAGNSGNLISTTLDDGVPRFRKKVIIAEQGSQLGVNNASDRAAWEMGRRWGRSHSLRLTTDSWRDSAGTLYAPNSLAPVDIPSLKLSGVLWTISEVTYRKGPDGTLCDLVLMPPSAFAVQPTLPANLLPRDVQSIPSGSAR